MDLTPFMNDCASHAESALNVTVSARKTANVLINEAGVLSDQIYVVAVMTVRFELGDMFRGLTTASAWPENALCLVNNDNGSGGEFKPFF